MFDYVGYTLQTKHWGGKDKSVFILSIRHRHFLSIQMCTVEEEETRKLSESQYMCKEDKETTFSCLGFIVWRQQTHKTRLKTSVGVCRVLAEDGSFRWTETSCVPNLVTEKLLRILSHRIRLLADIGVSFETIAFLLHSPISCKLMICKRVLASSFFAGTPEQCEDVWYRVDRVCCSSSCSSGRSCMGDLTTWKICLTSWGHQHTLWFISEIWSPGRFAVLLSRGENIHKPHVAYVAIFVLSFYANS